MTNFRYGSSFIISSLLYGALGYFLLTFLETHKKLIKESPQKVIKIALITPKPKPVVVPKPPVVTPPKEIVKPKPKPKKIIKKIVKKPKPKLKPKPKKIVKKIKAKPKPKSKPKPKKIVKKREPVIEEKFIEEEYFEPTEVVKTVEPQIIEEPTPPKPAPKPKVDNSAEKRAFLRGVRNQIKANKRYPKMALRRHVEGSVGVMFDIGANGDVSNIRFLNGKSILQKSVRKAVIQSFPIAIPSNIRSEFPMYNISVTVNFRIH